MKILKVLMISLILGVAIKVDCSGEEELSLMSISQNNKGIERHFVYEIYINNIEEDQLNENVLINYNSNETYMTFDEVVKYLGYNPKVKNPPFELIASDYDKTYKVIKNDEGQVIFDTFSFLFENNKDDKSFTLELSKASTPSTPSFPNDMSISSKYFGFNYYVGCVKDKSNVYIGYYTFNNLNYKLVGKNLLESEFIEVITYFMRSSKVSPVFYISFPLRNSDGSIACGEKTNEDRSVNVKE